MGKGPEVVQQPGIPPEFLPFLDQTLSMLQTALGNANNFQSPTGALGSVESILGVIPESGAEIGDIFGQGLTGLQTGIDEGFTPDILSDVEARLRPGVQRSFDQGQADIFEGAARAGQTRSTGTVESVGRLATGLESGLQNSLAGIESALAPIQAQQTFAGIQTALGLPGAAANTLLPMISAIIQESQFSRQLPVALATGGAANIPVTAPVVDPGKGGGPLGAAAQVGSAFIGRDSGGGGGSGKGGGSGGSPNGPTFGGGGFN